MTQNDLQKFYTRLKTSGRLKHTEKLEEVLSDRMVRGCHTTCRAALQKAVEEGMIHINPAKGCKLPPKKTKEMQALSREEMQRFLIQAKYDGYYEIFLMTLSTGLRRGEIMALQWSDINFKTGEIHIERQVYRAKAEKILKIISESNVPRIIVPGNNDVPEIIREFSPNAQLYERNSVVEIHGQNCRIGHEVLKMSFDCPWNFYGRGPTCDEWSLDKNIDGVNWRFNVAFDSYVYFIDKRKYFCFPESMEFA